MAEGNTVFPWTFDAVFQPIEDWIIDGSLVDRQISETATHQTLTLTFRVTSDQLQANLRPLKPNEGKVDVISTDSGGFVALDRANGGNTFTLEPPSFRKPLREEGEYHVRRYEEDLISQSVGEWHVEIEFVKAENRSDSNTINQAEPGAAFPWTFTQTFGGPPEWELTTVDGTIATDRVDADFIGTGQNGVERYELIMRLTQNQAHTWETALDKLQGVRLRNIPDAPNQAVDDTDTAENTINLSAPSDQNSVTSGDYVVMAWSSRRLNDAFQEVTAIIAVEG